MTVTDQRRATSRTLKRNVLAALSQRAWTVEELQSAFDAKRSTLSSLLCRLRTEMLAHDKPLATGKPGRVSAWHLGPAPYSAKDEAADTAPAKRIVRQSWPRDFPPPDPVLAHFYGRHA